LGRAGEEVSVARTPFTCGSSGTLEGILNYLCNELAGDWVIAGGSRVLLKFDVSRGTEDLGFQAQSEAFASAEEFRCLNQVEARCTTKYAETSR